MTLLALSACAPADILNLVTPNFSYTEKLGMAYGSDPRQVLDVYRPSKADKAPVIVFFYGTRWQGGNRRDFRFVADAFTSRGYVVVIPDYRFYPQVTFPAFVEDGAVAVRWAYDHIAETGGDPQRIFLAGQSSGAHTAVMLGLDTHFLAGAGVPATAIRGIVGISGPYDFMPFDPDVELVMGPPKNWPATQPVNYVRPDAPPMYLLHGDTDDIVKPGNSTSLESRQRTAGGDVKRKTYAGLDHYRPLVALAAPLRFVAPVLDDVTAWLGAHGGKVAQ